jgi:hypothetical protein
MDLLVLKIYFTPIYFTRCILEFLIINNAKLILFCHRFTTPVVYFSDCNKLLHWLRKIYFPLNHYESFSAWICAEWRIWRKLSHYFNGQEFIFTETEISLYLCLMCDVETRNYAFCVLVYVFSEWIANSCRIACWIPSDFGLWKHLLSGILLLPVLS